MTTGLRVVFAPARVTVETVRASEPRATLRLVSLGSPPSQLPEAQAQPCTLRFFVSYLNHVRTEGAPAPQPFATLAGQIERSRGAFVFTPDDASDPIEYDQPEQPPNEDDPRQNRPLEYELSFDEDQFEGVGDQTLEVPRAEKDEARFVELRVAVEVAGSSEVTVDTSDVWDIPYAPLERRVTLTVFEPGVKSSGAMLATNSAGEDAFNDPGERVDASRQFDFTHLPADDDYDLELSVGKVTLAPSLKLNIKNLELGLLLEDAQRAAQSITTGDNAVPDVLSGSETHDFGDIPFQETPGGGDFVVITLVDPQGAPLAGQAFVATSADGTLQDGFLDENGQAKLTGISPGDVLVELADDPEASFSADDEAAS